MPGEAFVECKKQPWFCEGCGAQGEVLYPVEDPGVMAVVYLIEDDHRAKSPDCTVAVESLRVPTVVDSKS